MLLKPPGMTEEEWEIFLLNLRRRRKRFRARLGLGGSGVTPGVVTANTGVFIVGGQDANLAYGRLPMPAAVGAFTVTGQAAGSVQQRSLSAAQGTFAVTGVAATLSQSAGGLPDNNTSSNEFLILFI